MRDEFPYDGFLSHSAKDKSVVRSITLSASTGERAGVRCRSPRFAERLRADGVLNNSQPELRSETGLRSATNSQTIPTMNIGQAS